MYHLISSSTNLYWPSTSQYRHILTQYHQVPLIIHHLVRHSSVNWIISLFTTHLMSHAQYTCSSFLVICHWGALFLSGRGWMDDMKPHSRVLQCSWIPEFHHVHLHRHHPHHHRQNYHFFIFHHHYHYEFLGHIRLHNCSLSQIPQLQYRSNSSQEPISQYWWWNTKIQIFKCQPNRIWRKGRKLQIKKKQRNKKIRIFKYQPDGISENWPPVVHIKGRTSFQGHKMMMMMMRMNMMMMTTTMMMMVITMMKMMIGCPHKRANKFPGTQKSRNVHLAVMKMRRMMTIMMQ